MTYDHTLTGLWIATALGIMAALIILWSSAYVALGRALDVRTDRRARQAARAQHIQRTRATEDTVALALNDACCETWWTSCGTHHDPTCPDHTHKNA
ncbi:hypothetical protein [Streptomyces sp. S.PB5]|uniref:hypothetical protein n=1 Tax=Streptomyces sp. S.PB5 TaxID=3020844 RepID=UPI0025AEFD9C|nr:hypothetical protein [Streptomyces sp. S.PB5]MDN3021556.1 hypothetical protein [Streptomyces sp. S.PB5]